MTGLVLFLIILILLGSFTAVSIITTKKALKENTETKLMKFWKKDTTKSIASSLVSIFAGMLIGCLILAIVTILPIKGLTISFKTFIDGIQLIFAGVFNTGKNDANQLIFGWNGRNLGDMLFKSMPLILTGLSVAVAFKTGLFNIGAPGQYLVSDRKSVV